MPIQPTSLPFMVAPVVVAAATACGMGSVSCPQMVSESVVVTVVDGRSAARVCDAEVILREGTFARRLDPYSSSLVDCTYSGVQERAGTYTVDVALGARTASLSDLMVERNICGVRTQRVTIFLP